MASKPFHRPQSVLNIDRYKIISPIFRMRRISNLVKSHLTLPKTKQNFKILSEYKPQVFIYFVYFLRTLLIGFTGGIKLRRKSLFKKGIR